MTVFAVIRLGQGGDARLANREMLGNAANRAVFTGGIPAFHDDTDLVAGLAGPDLGVDQGDLQLFEAFLGFVFLIRLARHAGLRCVGADCGARG